MGGLTIALFAAVYVALVLTLTLLVLRSFLRGVKAGTDKPYVPIPAIFPPVPVEPTAGVSAVGSLAIVWALVNLAVVAVWLVAPYYVPRSAPTVLAAAYVAFAMILVAIGGRALLLRRPVGRVCLSWGMILLDLVMFYAVIISFLLPSLKDVPDYLREQGLVLGVAGAFHLVLDTALGALGQRVGRPADWKRRQEERDQQAQQPFAAPDANMPGWDNLNQPH
jgi:hypothetical protein